MLRRRIGAAWLLALALAAQARAQTGGPSPHPDHGPPPGAMARSESEQRAARRLPQPVRVGALSGRDLLQPEESQPVLGRVAGLVHRDGGTALVVRLDGWLGLGWLGSAWASWPGFGPRLVSVPVEAVALMGEYVALMDLTPERLRALPTFAPGSAPEVPADEMIRVGIVRPFH